MAKIADFKTRYAQTVFAIYPAYWEQGIIGWGIINKNAELFGGEENVPMIHRTGVLKLFTTHFDSRSMDEVCEKLAAIWRHEFGYSREPAVLVIEKPEPALKSLGRLSNVVDPSIFVGLLMCTLSPGLTLVPEKVEWMSKKSSNTQADIENIVHNLNDYHSKKALKRDLEFIALHNRPQVYEALNMGIYGAEVELGIRPLPRHIRQAAPRRF